MAALASRVLYDFEDTEENPDLNSPQGFKENVELKIAALLNGVRPGTQGMYGPDGDSDGDVYNFSYPKRGLAIIVSNELFHVTTDGVYGDRGGSSYDAEALYDSFTQLGFDVLHYKNLRDWQMVLLLKTASTKYDHEDADCVVCSILTHGEETWIEREHERRGQSVRQDLLLGIDGKAVYTKTVIDLFNDTACPGLEGKPRLFFLQACRGTKLDAGQEIDVVRSVRRGVKRRSDRTDGGGGDGVATDGLDKGQSGNITTERQTSLSSSVDPPEYLTNLDRLDAGKGLDGEEEPAESGLEAAMEGLAVSAVSGSDGPVMSREHHSPEPEEPLPVYPPPLYKDCLVMYATPPGHYAWRRGTGTWFIQSLCKVLNREDLGETSFGRALIQVGGLVASNYESNIPSNPRMHAKKEMPVIESMLVKDIYLTNKV